MEVHTIRSYVLIIVAVLLVKGNPFRTRLGATTYTNNAERGSDGIFYCPNVSVVQPRLFVQFKIYTTHLLRTNYAPKSGLFFWSNSETDSVIGCKNSDTLTSNSKMTLVDHIF